MYASASNVVGSSTRSSSSPAVDGDLEPFRAELAELGELVDQLRVERQRDCWADDERLRVVEEAAGSTCRKFKRLKR